MEDRALYRRIRRLMDDYGTEAIIRALEAVLEYDVSNVPYVERILARIEKDKQHVYSGDPPIDALDLRHRTLNTLERAGIHYISDIYTYCAQHPETKLRSIRNLGARGVTEIQYKMLEKGFRPF